eukprot:270786-Pyramimonas_sp.AAC.1
MAMHPSCAAAERGLVCTPLYKRFNVLHLKCAVHRIANIHAKVMDFSCRDINAIIHASRAPASPSNNRRTAGCLGEAILG